MKAEVRLEMCIAAVFSDPRALNRACVSSFGERLGIAMLTDPVTIRSMRLDAMDAAVISDAHLRTRAVGHFGEYRVQLARLGSVMGLPRASYFLVRPPEDLPATELINLGRWLTDHLRPCWATIGYRLVQSGWNFAADSEAVIAMARRHWTAQILDPVDLQWSALSGIPGVSWITCCSREFAQRRGVAIDRIASDQRGSLTAQGVSVFAGTHGLVLAAGDTPISGDVNLGQPIAAYAAVYRCLRSLWSGAFATQAGELARPEVYGAWLRRFDDPVEWAATRV